ncbi:NADP-dependent oxidoreductase [Sphingopyxis macrogoltabida]|uniref:NADP-dependent oxidoreductase n=1 Tax=Sphingopyxis macrogoltabida TaxID=33050 RepID=A0AAC8Z0E3_SPHMC|nr:NADP-dependent oxidoreductase [Sphingopyxis macrogoltabida]ALJ12962.1 NADP-dependent oxidoreductase [Sphingopyxis macrogoltabida]AMU89571.1 NADP-dependent oxidoreductase [Sphingopyxis macrogoltabida]
MAKAWHLISRPTGLPTMANFALRDLPDAPLESDQLRVRNLWLSVDPYMRGRMNDAKSYAASFQIDQPMTGGAIGEVIESRLDGFAPGDLVLHMGGWRDGGVIGLDMMPNKLPAAALAAGMTPQTFLHNMGLTGGTAWIGLLRIAAAKPGDVVFVSAAAGAVGSAVVQIAKAREMTVIGSAGGAEKCTWVSALGADAVIDYKGGPVLPALAAALQKLGKGGVDVYFDNVGGEHLDAAFATASDFARFAICGMIDVYNDGKAQEMKYLIRAIPARIRMEGFIYTDQFIDCMEEFYADMGALIAGGAVTMRETVHDGLEATPQAFLGLFSGDNIGKMLVRL